MTLPSLSDASHTLPISKWPRTPFQLSPVPSVPVTEVSPAPLSLYHCLYLLGWPRSPASISLLLTGPAEPIDIMTLPCPALLCGVAPLSSWSCSWGSCLPAAISGHLEQEAKLMQPHETPYSHRAPRASSWQN